LAGELQKAVVNGQPYGVVVTNIEDGMHMHWDAFPVYRCWLTSERYEVTISPISGEVEATLTVQDETANYEGVDRALANAVQFLEVDIFQGQFQIRAHIEEEDDTRFDYRVVELTGSPAEPSRTNPAGSEHGA
jgi:hypothetical protein